MRGPAGCRLRGNYCKDDTSGISGLKQTLRYGRDLDLDSLRTTDRATWRSSKRRLAWSWWGDQPKIK